MEQSRKHRTLTNTLLRVSRAYKTSADKVAALYGLTQATAWPAVIIHQMGDNGVRPGEVADALGLDPSSVVRVIDQLIASNMLVRKEDPHDRRAKILTLTDDGKKRVSQINTAMLGFRKEVLGEIDAAKLDTCIQVLEQIEQALRIKKS